MMKSSAEQYISHLLFVSKFQDPMCTELIADPGGYYFLGLDDKMGEGEIVQIFKRESCKQKRTNAQPTSEWWWKMIENERGGGVGPSQTLPLHCVFGVSILFPTPTGISFCTPDPPPLYRRSSIKLVPNPIWNNRTQSFELLKKAKLTTAHGFFFFL